MFKVNIHLLQRSIEEFNKYGFLFFLIESILLLIFIRLGLRIRGLSVPFVTYAEKEKNWYLKKEFII
jgi:hypothetical protein